MDTYIKKICLILPLLMCAVFLGNAQQNELFISGSVLDVDGLKPLPGTTITNVGTSEVMQADRDGYFRIQVRPGDMLHFVHMTYHKARFSVPADLQNSQVAMVQLLRVESQLEESSISEFPTQMHFERRLLQVDPGDMTPRTRALDNNLGEATYDPSRMSKYMNEFHFYQRLYILPEGGTTNNFINPERWKNFIRDWREGRTTGDSFERMQIMPDRSPGVLNDGRQ